MHKTARPITTTENNNLFMVHLLDSAHGEVS
jgi:hypothetical protein